mgnify:FL=1
MSASTTKPTVPEVLPLVRAVYARHCAGCCLHIMTDDGNCEQSNADFCLQAAREGGHPDCLAAAEMLARMSLTQRRKVYHTK